MDCACVTILEKNCVEAALVCPKDAFGRGFSGLVCATVIQATEESVESLRRRVRRRLSLITPRSARRLRVVYRVGEDHSEAARTARMSLCQEAVSWLLHCKGGAVLQLVLPEPRDPRVRHDFMSLIGDLNLDAGGVVISITFEGAQRRAASRPGQEAGHRRSLPRALSATSCDT